MQKIKDELKNNIYNVLEKEGCPIKKQGKGRPRKGEGSQEQAFKWLWETEFKKWLAEQSSRVGADAAPNDWQGICKAMIENHQRQLTSNSLRHDSEDAKFEREQIYSVSHPSEVLLIW